MVHQGAWGGAWGVVKRGENAHAGFNEKEWLKESVLLWVAALKVRFQTQQHRTDLVHNRIP